MSQDIHLFFSQSPLALPLYEMLEQKILSEIEDVYIRVQKTQITFSNKHVFACVSFIPVLKVKERPSPYLVVTFGLRYKKQSSRITAAVEPYPNRWTHHVVISSLAELDDELMGWVKEASVFSASKR